MLKLAGIHHKAKYSIRQAPINRKTFYLKCLKYFYTFYTQSSKITLKKLYTFLEHRFQEKKISKSEFDTTI